MANSKKDAQLTEDKTPAAHQSFITNGQNWLIPGLLSTIAVLLIILLAQGWNNHPGRRSTALAPQRFSRQAERGMMSESRGFLDESGNHVVGAVTAVNGASFTVVGNGTSTAVDTNSSTKYWGGSGVKVNDTVAVLGTNNNGTITATQIVINP